jgi:hypothetical protein
MQTADLLTVSPPFAAAARDKSKALLHIPVGALPTDNVFANFSICLDIM